MIIDFNRYNGGGGSGSGVTPQEVQRQIDSALTPYWESGETKDYVDGAVSGIDLSNYYTSAQTEDAISAATSGKADAANVTPNDFMHFPKWNAQGIVTGTTGNNLSTTGFYLNGRRITVIKEQTSGDIGDVYAATTPGTAGDILVSVGNGAPVWSAVTMPDMTAYTPTSGFSTINGSAITNGGNIVIQGGGGDMSNYWNSAETKSYVDSAATNLQDQIDTMDDVVAAALVDLNDRVDEISGSTPDLSNYWTSAQTQDAISAATQDMVSSTYISTIWKGTQAQYDAIVTKDPDTFYIIVNSN